MCAVSSSAMHPLPRDFSEFLRLLNGLEVRYLIVGGYALAFHGYVRATGDLGLFVENSPTNADKLVRALREFGFDVPELGPELFTREKSLVRLGREPVRLELLNEISGVTFAECYANRAVADVEGLPLPFIQRADLIRNKLATGRAKDRADAEELRRRQSGVDVER